MARSNECAPEGVPILNFFFFKRGRRVNERWISIDRKSVTSQCKQSRFLVIDVFKYVNKNLRWAITFCMVDGARRSIFYWKAYFFLVLQTYYMTRFTNQMNIRSNICLEVNFGGATFYVNSDQTAMKYMVRRFSTSIFHRYGGCIENLRTIYFMAV